MAPLRTKSSSATRFKLSGITLRFTKGRSGAELPSEEFVRPDRSERSRLNHNVAIVERRSFDRAKSNPVEQDAVLGEAALFSIHCEHQVQIKKWDLSIDHTRRYLFAGLGEEGLNDDQAGVGFHGAAAVFQNAYRIGIIPIVEDEPQQIEISFRHRLKEIAANRFGAVGKPRASAAAAAAAATSCRSRTMPRRRGLCCIRLCTSAPSAPPTSTATE